MNVIAKHLEGVARDSDMDYTTIRTATATNDSDAKVLPPPEPSPAPLIPDEELTQSFMKKQLLKRDDWPEWEKAQTK
jgi:hypothetical protein